MPDEPVTPAMNPAELLAKLEAIVNGNKTPAADGGSKSKSWVSYLIIAAVVLIAIAVWSWLSYRSNRELAKLRHEKETARIMAEKAAIDAQVSTNDAIVADAQADIVVAEKKLEKLAVTIQTEEERYAANLRAIDRIRSWDDVPGGR